MSKTVVTITVEGEDTAKQANEWLEKIKEESEDINAVKIKAVINTDSIDAFEHIRVFESVEEAGKWKEASPQNIEKFSDKEAKSAEDEKVAVSSSTQTAEMLNTLKDSDEWLHSREIADATESETLTTNQVSSLLTGATNRNLVKRRERRDFQSHAQSGPRYEYKITDIGEKALERGERKAP